MSVFEAETPTDSYLLKVYGQERAAEYHRAGRLSRWVMTRFFPEIAEFIASVEDEQSPLAQTESVFGEAGLESQLATN